MITLKTRSAVLAMWKSLEERDIPQTLSLDAPQVSIFALTTKNNHTNEKKIKCYPVTKILLHGFH